MRKLSKALQWVVLGSVVIAVCTGLYLVTWGQGYLVSENTAVHALEVQGFTNVKVTHRACHFLKWRGAGTDDDVRFTCEADNPKGERVTVYVFVGWPFKGATIRN